MAKYKTKKIVLASSSPRRREVLGKLGLHFEIDTGEYEEDMTLKMPPRRLAIFLSKGKALSVAKHHKNSLVIGADSFVVVDNEIFGKPKSVKEAAAMLKNISGKKVIVLTAFTIIDTSSGKHVSKTDETNVFIKKLSSSEIKNYIATGEPMDKAGAFAIQGLGAIFIKRIEGDFFGVLGLPLFVLAQELKKFGIKIL